MLGIHESSAHIHVWKSEFNSIAHFITLILVTPPPWCFSLRLGGYNIWHCCFFLGFCLHCSLFSEHWKVLGLFNDCCPIQHLFTLRLLTTYVCKNNHKRRFYRITMSKIIIGLILWLMNLWLMIPWVFYYNFCIKLCSPSWRSCLKPSKNTCLPHNTCVTIATVGRYWAAKQCYSILFRAVGKTMNNFYLTKHPE